MITEKKTIYGGVIIPDFWENASIYDRLAYAICFVYEFLVTKIPKTSDFSDYSEKRAVVVPEVIIEYMREKGIVPLRKSNPEPLTLRGKFDNDNTFAVKTVVNTCRYFTSNASKENNIQKPNVAGNCWTRGKTMLKGFRVVANVTFLLSIKTTSPFTGGEYDPYYILDTTIHEYVHFMDKMKEIYGPLANNRVFYREWLSKILENFFCF
jgi:hypothetical protein